MSNKQQELPDWLLRGVSNGRTRQLAREVWRRLPEHDRVMLYEQLSAITESDEAPNAETAIAYAGAFNPNSVFEGHAAQIAENLTYEVSLFRLLQVESDQAARFVIAHEFAHVILHHDQMGLVVNSLLGLKYTDEDVETLRRWREEHADLQAWLWGFREEMEAYLDAYPDRERPRWHEEIKTIDNTQ